jgi:uncharacterized membrane protein
MIHAKISRSADPARIGALAGPFGDRVLLPAMSVTVSLPRSPAPCVVARRNISLAPRQRWTVYGALAAGSLALALSFAAGGVWPVLPFSVLELACLALAFLWVERRSRDVDRLTLDGDRVVVERERAGRTDRHEFARHWLRVELGEEGWAHEPRLWLRSGRDALAFGDAVPAGEREALARAIRGMLAAH